MPYAFEILHLYIKVKFQRAQECCHLETGFGRITVMGNKKKGMVIVNGGRILRTVAESEVSNRKSSNEGRDR